MEGFRQKSDLAEVLMGSFSLPSSKQTLKGRGRCGESAQGLTTTVQSSRLNKMNKLIYSLI